MAHPPQGELDFNALSTFYTKLDREFEEWMQTPGGQRLCEEAHRRVRRLRERGVEHYGIGAIWESIRFDWTVSGNPEDEFKANNNYRSRLARFIMDEDPKLEGFFEIRTLRS